MFPFSYLNGPPQSFPIPNKQRLEYILFTFVPTIRIQIQLLKPGDDPKPIIDTQKK